MNQQYSNSQLKYEICRLRYLIKHDFASAIESHVLDSLEAEWQRRYNKGEIGQL